MANDTEAKKTDADYAEELSQKYKVLDRFGLKNVILEACAHVRAEQREKLIAAARRGAEMARDDVYRIKEPTLETGGLSEVEYKHSIDEVLDVYTKELDGDE